MKKENKVRLIFWGIIWIIMVLLSTIGLGLYMNGIGKNGKVRKLLKPANDAFNNLNTVQRYRDAGIEVSSKLKNDRIRVRYKTDTIDASYDFIYDTFVNEDIIYMEFNNQTDDKNIGISVARFMIDALAVKNGHTEGEIFINYQFDYFYKTSVIQGLNITDEGTNTVVRINLNKVVTDNIKDVIDIDNTSDIVKEWNTRISLIDTAITVIAKKDIENYSTFKTDISSICDTNGIYLTWIDYEDLSENDIKYLTDTYSINTDNIYTMITNKNDKNYDIVGYKTYDELINLLKEKGTIK